MAFFIRIVVALIGLGLSIYSLQVEYKASADKNYKAFCDINAQMSCTKVFKSKYGKGFGLVEGVLGRKSIFNQPNPTYGIIFYTGIIFLCFFSHHVPVLRFMVHLSVISCIMSIYLAYALYKLQDTCVVCITTYVVNFALLFLNFRELNQAPEDGSKIKKE